MYREHRQRFLAALRQDGAAAVIPTATSKLRNNDSEYRFRPSSDFWYLTGFGEPESVLVLLPRGQCERGALPKGEPESVLFLRERNAAEEVWTGRRLGVERAPAALGVDRAYPIEELETRLPQLLRGYARLSTRTGEDPDQDRRFLRALARLRKRAGHKAQWPVEIVDPGALLHELRLFKTPAELERMRRAAAISASAHVAAMAAAGPGVNEREIEALIEYTFRRQGANGPAYNSIIAGGANACILHYVENDMPLVDGELLLVDAGAEFECYASDVTRTFPVNGTFTPEQRAIYDVVLGAQKATLAIVAPGVSTNALHELALTRLVEGLVDLGLLRGSVEQNIADESYRRFYMHGVSHWLGLDVHDCGAYQVGGEARLLEPGMVTTVEPGIYVAPDDETVERRWRGIGVRIEDDVLVTAEGHENLTAAIPKEADEVEAACAGRSLQEA